MAAKRIKGITVEIDGSTTGLDKALSGTNSNLSKVQNSLKDVNRLLKIDPKNTELLTQKQKLLAQAVEETKKKLDTLKSASEQASKTVGNYDAWKKAYTPIQEEIGKTREKIKSLKEEMTGLEKAGKVDTTEYKALGEELKKEEDSLKNLQQKAKEVNAEFGNPISHEQYDALQREIAETEQQLKGLEKQAKASASVLGTQMQEVGKTINEAGNKITDAGKKLLPVTGGITAVGAAAVKTSSDFESAISDLAATMGTTKDNITELSETARDMGSTTSFSATEAAQGLNILAMSGLDVKEQISAIKPVLDLASSGSISLGSAASYAMGSVKGFGDSCDNAQYYADLMAKGSTLASTDVNGLGEALSGSAATAKSYGQAADSTTLSLLRLAEQNVTGSEATTALNRAMADLFTPTDTAKKALDELGVAAYNMDGSARDINNVIDDLSAAMAGMSAEEANAYKHTIFTTEGLSAFNKMTSTSKEKVDSFKEGLAGASDGMGSAAEQAKTKLDNLEGQVTILKSAISEAAISIGEVLTPIIKEIVSKIQEWTDKFNSLDAGQKKTIVTIAAVIAAVAPLLIIIGKVISAVGIVTSGIGKVISILAGISGPVLAVIAAIAAVIAIGVALYKNWDTVKEKCSEIWGNIKETVSNTVEGIKTAVTEKFEAIKQKISDTFTTVKDTLTNVWETIKNVIQVAIMLIVEVVTAAFELITLPWQFIWENCKEYVFSAWESIKTGITSVLEAISTTISNIWNAIVSFLTPILESIKNTFSVVWEAISSTVSTILEGIMSRVTVVWESIKTIITTVINVVSSVVSSGFNAVYSAVTSIMNSVKSIISSVWNAISSVVSNVINTVKTTISNGLNAAKNTVTNILNSIKSAFSNILDGAVSVVSKAIDRIKSVFNFSWSLPKLKLPHISISGEFSINPPSVPHFGISWYKKAYDRAMVMDMPTIFGYSEKTGRLLGGGEGNGREVISGEDHLINLIDNVVSGRNGPISDRIERLTAVVQKGFPQVIKNMERDVVLDSGGLVGRVQPKIDNEFGSSIGKAKKVYQMIYGVLFGDKHSFKDWQLTLEERPVISSPVPKVVYVDVPGLDAFIDMTETMTGDVAYHSRTIEFTFTTRKVRKKWNKMYSDIASYLHGQRMRIILDEDKGYFYIGRVAVNEWKSDIKYSTIVIEAEVDPYKYERYSSVEPWVWDVFPFEGGIIREYKDLEVNGTMILIIPGRRKKVVPVFDCSAAMNLEYGGKTYYLPAGRSKILDLQLGEGEHFLTFQGTGKVSVDYRGASL